MATRLSPSLQMTNSTAALFQAWIGFIDALLTTSGWVNTADTGQLNLATAAVPAAANTKVGYRIYRMADALQATSPVFLRIDFGSGTAASSPGIWLTIGTGSSGAGVITGIAFNGGAAAGPTVTSGANGLNACNSYGSASTNRMAIMMFVRAAANDIMICSIERSKDSNGADTGDGILLGYQADGGTGLNRTQYVILAGGGQPPVETGVTAPLSNQAASAFGSNVGVGVPLFFKSNAQQPGTGLVVVNSGDFLAEAQFTMSLYGTVITFQLGNSPTNQSTVPTGNTVSAVRATTRVGIRFD